MATLSNKDGRRLVQFELGGVRRTVRLGKIDHKSAILVRTHIEHLLANKLHGAMIPNTTAEWMSTIDAEFHERISRTGLVAPREAVIAITLAKFFDGYIKKRSDLKKNTIENFQQARNSIVDCMGEFKDIRTITKGDGTDWKNSLAKTHAPATIGTFVKKARQVLASAVEHKIIQLNPLDGVVASRAVNKARQLYVPSETIESVIDACPDDEWRLIFALSRWGGIRIPSELTPLKITDVDWDKRKIRITSPKTERHEGKSERFIPLFPELEPYLLKVIGKLDDGAEFIINRHRGENLRTMAEKIIARASLKQWPKLFQNLRASRETDLAAVFPLHVVCAWIGNSEAVAIKSYMILKDADFVRASAKASGIDSPDALQNALRTGADNTGHFQNKNEKPPFLEGVSTNPYPQGESNPCSLAENQMSWATRRWGQLHFNQDKPNPTRPATNVKKRQLTFPQNHFRIS
jgi:integrase